MIQGSVEVRVMTPDSCFLSGAHTGGVLKTPLSRFVGQDGDFARWRTDRERPRSSDRGWLQEGSGTGSLKSRGRAPSGGDGLARGWPPAVGRGAKHGEGSNSGGDCRQGRGDCLRARICAGPEGMRGGRLRIGEKARQSGGTDPRVSSRIGVSQRVAKGQGGRFQRKFGQAVGSEFAAIGAFVIEMTSLQVCEPRIVLIFCIADL
jgi:hypothetical protein